MKTAEEIPSPLEFLSSRLDDVAPERYPAHSVRIICAAAIEEYHFLKSKELKEQLSSLQEENSQLKKFRESDAFELKQSKEENQRLKEALDRVRNLLYRKDDEHEGGWLCDPLYADFGLVLNTIDTALNPPLA